MYLRETGITSALLFTWVVILTGNLSHTMTGARQCRFPKNWRGKWHWNLDRSLGEVIVGENAIKSIGECVQRQNRDYYVMKSTMSDEVCFKCVFLISRDHNVLQYRESYCTTEQKFEQLCEAITGEFNFYTLIRVDTHQSVCPTSLRGQFSISYQNHTEQYCFSPVNKMTSCASDRQLTFQLGACTLLGTHAQEFVVHCLASWKHGARMVLYGKVQYLDDKGNKIQTQNATYRCFVYEEYGPEVRMSVSADASCQSFMKMTLTQSSVLLAPNSQQCSYPVWMQGSNWLEAKAQTIFNVTSSHVRVHKYKNTADIGRITHQLYCVSSNVRTESDIVISTRVTHRCSVYYQCLRLRKLTSNVVQFSQGAKSQTSTTNCVDEMLHRNISYNQIILIKENANRLDECSLQGSYSTALSSPSKMHKRQCSLLSVQAGCTVPSVITLNSVDSNNQIGPASFGCVAQWREENVEYCIMQESRHGTYTCLMLEDDNYETPWIYVNHRCQKNRGNICKVLQKKEPCLKNRIVKSESSSSTEIKVTIHDVSKHEPSSAKRITYHSKLPAFYAVYLWVVYSI